MIKLLVVDDSALMRSHLVKLFESEPGFVVQAVRNGKEALGALAGFEPDVITLDINMPEMDGLTCLSHIMVQRPTPVVMVSSLTEKGAEATFEALELGAVDFIHKPSGTISLSINTIEADLIAKVRSAARARLRRAHGLKKRVAARWNKDESAPRRAMAQTASVGMGMVLIGSSTGGPGALEEVLSALPGELPWPIIVSQHMPASFTEVFARRLDSVCQLRIMELSRQTTLEPGCAYVARGDADVGFRATSLGVAAVSTPKSERYLWHPSVAYMLTSAMSVLPPNQLIGVMLTGMGDDGAKEMTELRARGGRTIAQDESTSVVFGMPGELVRRGGADVVLPVEGIARQLQLWLAAARPKLRGGRAHHGAG